MAETLEEGTMLGRTYRVGTLIARGGSTDIYEAVDTASGVEVALKVLRAEYRATLAARAAQMEEAHTLLALGLDTAVTAFDVLDEPGLGPVLVLERIRGAPLLERLRRDGPLPLSELMPIGSGLFSALAAVHARGWSHGALKASDVIVGEADPSRVRLIDFQRSRRGRLGTSSRRSRRSQSFAAPVLSAIRDLAQRRQMASLAAAGSARRAIKIDLGAAPKDRRDSFLMKTNLELRRPSSMALGVLLVLGVSSSGCGDDSGTGGAGATSSDGGSSNVAVGGANGDSGGGDAGCTVITDIADLQGYEMAVTPSFFGRPEPSLGAGLEDEFQLGLPLGMTGSRPVALPTKLSQCAVSETCIALAEDRASTGVPSVLYFGSSGSLDVSAVQQFYATGSLSDVTLVEVNVQGDAVVPVSDGRCVTIASFTFDIQPPAVGWFCHPAWYDEIASGIDGSCDCGCGAIDPDCSVPDIIVTGCEPNQVCSGDGECQDPA